MFLFTQLDWSLSETDTHWMISSDVLSMVLWAEKETGPFANIELLSAEKVVYDRILDELALTLDARMPWQSVMLTTTLAPRQTPRRIAESFTRKFAAEQCRILAQVGTGTIGSLR